MEIDNVANDLALVERGTLALVASTSSDDWSLSLPRIDESNAPENMEVGTTIGRFITYLDQIDTKVEKLRKEAMDLQEKKDMLLLSIDLIKNHENLQKMDEAEREEVNYYVQRVGIRLATVDLSVKTIRDKAQEEALHQINVLIDSLITSGDPMLSRQRCQTFFNACSGSDDTNVQKFQDTVFTQNIDKKFENYLLGCTLDDQKNIKRRLQALINYLNKQTVTD